MFRPNMTGRLWKRGGYNLYGEASWSDPITVRCAPVALSRFSEKTAVRADSSASRGASDEVVVDAKVLVTKDTDISIDDRFEIYYRQYRVIEVHPRFTVLGELDHLEIDLEDYAEDS